MSALLLNYREPSQRASVRPWAVLQYRNAEQERACQAAMQRERKMERARRKKRMQERSQMFAVSYMLTLSDDVQAMGVGCITIVGGNLLKPLKPQFLKEIRRLEKQTDRGGRVESYIAWMPVPERSEA